MATVFVTGAGGQIGLPLVRALVARGDEVIALVRTPQKEEAVRSAGAEVLAGSLEDDAVLERGMARATRVFHLAGGTRGPGAMDADRLNHDGTRRLREVALRAAGRLESFVYASSCAVYGDRSGLWVEEDYAPAPHTAYGRSKVAAESLLIDAARDRALPARIARIAAVYGRGLRFALAEPIARGRAYLPGEGRNHVPVVHVDDCVAALLAIDAGGRDGAVYHVADRSSPMLKEFYGAVHARVGGKPVVFWSTWIPSALQFRAARANEAVQARMGRKPSFTEDNLRLFTSSVRLKTDRLEKELAFAWKYPDYRDGISASFDHA